MELEVKNDYRLVPPNEAIKIFKYALKEIGIEINEKILVDENKIMFSCRVQVNNDSLLQFNIGVNGKGTSKELSLASGYGEFIERLQNNVLFTHTYFASNDFLNQNKYEFASYYNTILNNNLILSYRFGPDEEIRDGKITLPFYNVIKNRVDNLPIAEILKTSSSTGMSSGNAPLEAIIQGVDEIFERYFIKEIIIKNIILPLLSKENDSEYYVHYIRKLEEKYNWEIQIRDCSLLTGINAYGILILDLIGNKYRFSLGVGKTIKSIIESVLGELFQGGRKPDLVDIDIPYQTELMEDNNLKQIEILKNIHNRSGHYPINIFNNNITNKKNNIKENNYSIDDYFRVQLDAIKALDFDLFIRDVSYIGIPTYHCYVPGMSETRDLFITSEDVNLPQLFIKLNSITKLHYNERAELIRILEKKDELYLGLYKFYNKKRIFSIEKVEIILSILYFKNNDFKMARVKIQEYLSMVKDDNQIIFFTALRDYIYLSEKGSNTKILDTIYGEEMSSVIINFFKDDFLISNFNLPECFNCTNCYINSSCNYFELIKLVKSIQEIFLSNIPSQSNLKTILNKSIK